MQIHLQDQNVIYMRDLCKKIYREAHPELDNIRISDNKIIYEMMKFYLRYTRFNNHIKPEK